MVRSEKRPLKKGIFKSGDYVQHFTPEDRWNPFTKIYKQKKEVTLKIIQRTDDHKNILDIGGGMGRISLSLARSTGNNIVLTDLSVDMLKLVEEQKEDLNNLNIVNADAHSLPYKNEYFDYVVGLDLLCHLDKPEVAIAEIRRVLKDNGRLIFDSTNSNPLWTIFYPRYLGKNPVNWIKTMKYKGVSPGWEKIVKHYPKEKFISLLTDAGFEILESYNFGPCICPKWHMALSRKV